MNWLYLIPFVLVFTMLAGMSFVVFKVNHWKALPELEDYLKQENTQNEQNQTQCLHCQSTNIVEVGEWGKNSVERTFNCGECQQTLYRGA